MSRSFALPSVLILLASLSFAQERLESKAHSLRGTVVNSDSTPVPDAMVEVRNSQSGAVQGRAYTSGSGEFHVEGIQPGQYVITVVDGTRTTQQQFAFDGLDPEIRISVPSEMVPAKGKGTTVSVSNLRVPEKAKRAVESAQKALVKNKLEEAEAQLQRALSIAPQYPDAFSLRAVLYLVKGDSNAAMADAHHSVELDGTNSLAYTILGACYNATGQFPKAVESLQQSIKIDPTSWQSHFEIAKSFYGEGRSASALSEVDTALKSAPKGFAEIHLVRGSILMRLHRNNEAADEFQQFLKQDPKNPEAAKVERTLASISQPESNSAENGAH